jgi:hypothetical protein
MIAMLLRRNSWLLTTLISVSCFSQDCNRSTISKRDEQFIPTSVCIPKGFVISRVYTKYNDIDFNNDRKFDCVFAMNKVPLGIGDSSYLVFYKMNSDSSYSLIKTFGNIYPLNFDPNIEHPNLVEPKLIEAFECYGLPDPLYSLEIESDTVTLMQRLDGREIEKIEHVYKFNVGLDDWVLISKRRIMSDNVTLLEVDGMKLLSNFSYCGQ